MPRSQSFNLTVSLTTEQAAALAQLCKRFGVDHAKALSNAFDQGAEAAQMLGGMIRLEKALKEAGYWPR